MSAPKLSAQTTNPVNALSAKQNLDYQSDKMSLEQWVTSTFYSGKKSTDNSMTTETLSRFGLKNAQEVIAFLKSYEGKSLITQSYAQLAAESEMQERLQQFALLEQSVVMHHLRALLFLWFIEEESQASAIQELELSQQQEKLLHQDSAKYSNTNLAKANQERLGMTLGYYDQALAILGIRQNQNETEKKELEDLLVEINHQQTQVDETFKFFTRYLDEIDSFVNGISNLDELTYREMIQEILAHNHQQSAQVNQSEGGNEDTKNLRNQLLGGNLQVEMLKHLLSVFRDEKYYVNAEGETVTSYKDAAFILDNRADNRQQLVKYEGKLYLLKPGQGLDSIKENQHAKQEARTLYKSSKPALMTTFNVIERNKIKEAELLKQQFENVQTRIEQNKANQVQLNQNVIHLQAARGNSLALASQALLMQKVPASTPSMNPSPSPKPSLTPRPVPHYKEQLLALQKLNTPITPNHLFTLADSAPQNDRQSLRNYLNIKLVHRAMNAPLSPQESHSLLRHMEQFGSVSKRSAPGGPTFEATEESRSPRPSPNPLKTDPFK